MLFGVFVVNCQKRQLGLLPGRGCTKSASKSHGKPASSADTAGFDYQVT
jgi:hypothetical protein